MPLARANAAEASLPTLVDEGNVCLRIRRTHASGGSNSIADGGPLAMEVATAGLPWSFGLLPPAIDADAGVMVGSWKVQIRLFSCH